MALKTRNFISVCMCVHTKIQTPLQVIYVLEKRRLNKWRNQYMFILSFSINCMIIVFRYMDQIYRF